MSPGIDTGEHDGVGQIFPWILFSGSAEKEDVDSVFVGLFQRFVF